MRGDARRTVNKTKQACLAELEAILLNQHVHTGKGGEWLQWETLPPAQYLGVGRAMDCHLRGCAPFESEPASRTDEDCQTRKKNKGNNINPGQRPAYQSTHGWGKCRQQTANDIGVPVRGPSLQKGNQTLGALINRLPHPPPMTQRHEDRKEEEAWMRPPC